MGYVDHIAEAKQLCEEKLHFRIVDGDSSFNVAVDRAGKKRFELALRCVELWQRPGTKGRDKYYRLMEILRLITPDKAPGTKYRNAGVQAAMGYGRQLDAELGDILRREP